jgi:xylulose-5-phosphate/fructose-6-phosphate phosphoketolase
VGDIGSHFKQYLRDQLIRHKQYIVERGEDMPEVRNWKWAH